MAMRRDMLQASTSTSSAAPFPPPRTHGAVIRQARDALRRFRQDKAAGLAPKPGNPDEPYRLVMQLPLPTEALSEMLPGGGQRPPLEERPFALPDESEWPGGVIQRFRACRAVAERILDGYDAKFVGMLESPADGVGCWSLDDATIVGIVTNATFRAYSSLCEGKYGSRLLGPDHAIILLNPEWTSSRDIGQPWDRQLKSRAKALIDDAKYTTLYECSMLRTSRGKRFGMKVGSYGNGWALYAAQTEESDSVQDECLLSSSTPISRATAVEALSSRKDV